MTARHTPCIESATAWLSLGSRICLILNDFDAMKISRLLMALLMTLAMLVSCQSESGEVVPTPEEPTEDVKAAAVNLKLDATSQSSITFTVDSSDAVEVRWLCVAQSMTATITGENVMTQGVAVEANVAVSVTVDELLAGATYEVYGAASNSEGEITMASALVVMTEAGDVAEATYMLGDNITASTYVLETNGLRNDYVSFYDASTGYTLFIDFYSPIDGAYLPSGEYPLGDGSSMTSAQEYTYLTLYTDGDLLRFVDGKATVVAHYDAVTNVTTHSVTAYYTMESGETVSLQYGGIFKIE